MRGIGHRTVRHAQGGCITGPRSIAHAYLRSHAKLPAGHVLLFVFASHGVLGRSDLHAAVPSSGRRPSIRGFCRHLAQGSFERNADLSGHEVIASAVWADAIAVVMDSRDPVAVDDEGAAARSALEALRARVLAPARRSSALPSWCWFVRPTTDTLERPAQQRLRVARGTPRLRERDDARRRLRRV